MRGIDFSSWQSGLTTLLGLALVSLIAVGIRLLFMQTVQQKRERENRQINERLRTLIAAYKTLGGSFTGQLAVDPTHLRDSKEPKDSPAAERRRRMRDSVEAALSDILLLGTEEQVRLAARAANELAAGRSVEIAELVVSLRVFIREVLALDPMPPEIVLPPQGPQRPTPGGSKGNARAEGGGGGNGGGGNGGLGGGGGSFEKPHHTTEPDDDDSNEHDHGH